MNAPCILLPLSELSQNDASLQFTTTTTTPNHASSSHPIISWNPVGPNSTLPPLFSNLMVKLEQQVAHDGQLVLAVSLIQGAQPTAATAKVPHHPDQLDLPSLVDDFPSWDTNATSMWHCHETSNLSSSSPPPPHGFDVFLSAPTPTTTSSFDTSFDLPSSSSTPSSHEDSFPYTPQFDAVQLTPSMPHQQLDSSLLLASPCPSSISSFSSPHDLSRSASLPATSFVPGSDSFGDYDNYLSSQPALACRTSRSVRRSSPFSRGSASSSADGEKPRFNCSVCQETFLRKHDQFRHENRKHGLWQDKACAACGKIFSRPTRLQNHRCDPTSSSAIAATRSASQHKRSHSTSSSMSSLSSMTTTNSGTLDALYTSSPDLISLSPAPMFSA